MSVDLSQSLPLNHIEAHRPCPLSGQERPAWCRKLVGWDSPRKDLEGHLFSLLLDESTRSPSPGSAPRRSYVTTERTGKTFQNTSVPIQLVIYYILLDPQEVCFLGKLGAGFMEMLPQRGCFNWIVVREINPALSRGI